MDLSFPKFLSIQTTSRCNASCVFCPYESIKDLFPRKIMDMGLYKKIIDECSQYKNVERVILYMNNEPLTDPHLIERINYAKEKVPWSSVHILTNGLLLDDNVADGLVGSELDWVGISFHGIREETIEKTMGISYKLALDRICNFIKKAEKRGKNIREYIMITFLKHRYLTDEEKQETINFWRSKGIEKISYFDGPISRAGNVKNLPRLYHTEQIVGCNSIWADEMIHIVEDGKVILCCMDWKREVVLGDINSEELYTVWNGNRRSAWEGIRGKRPLPADFICRRCEEAGTDRQSKDNSLNVDVLLVNLPPWGVDSPALGTACLGSYLRDKGIPTTIYDLNIKLYNRVPEMYKYLWEMNYSYFWRQQEKYNDIKKAIGEYILPLIDEIIRSPADVFAISLPTNCSDLLVRDIVARIKEADPGKKIVLGGVSISITEQRVPLLKDIKDYIDFCVVGEGEEALHQLMSSISRNSDYKIAGVLNKKDFFNKVAPVYIRSLANLPAPTFEGLNLNEYKIPESIIVEFSRGCIGNCPFCDFKSVSPFYRVKPADYIYKQIKLYKRKYHIKHISVCDAALNGDMKVLEELCDLLIKNKIRIDISGLAIPRKEMTRNLLSKMKRAGFVRLEYGIESGSNKILRSMRKIFTPEIAEKVLRDTYEVGIKTCLYFIVGFPGESEDDFCKTKEFIQKNSKYISLIKSINPLYIMAGSEIFNKSKDYGIDIPDVDGDIDWVIPTEGNTRQMRERRIVELRSLLKQEAIPYTEEAECLEFTEKALNSKFAPAVDFLIVNLPPWGQNNPHIGIGYLCSYLRSRGIYTKLIDLNKRFFIKQPDFGMLWHVENKNFWLNEKTFSLVVKVFKKEIEDAVKEVSALNPQAVGFSVVDPKERLTVEFIRRLRTELLHTKIILGGPATSTQEQREIFIDNINDYVDVFVVGEGEEVCYEVLKRIKNREALKGIDGTVVRENGRWSYTPFKPIEPLEKLSFPTYEEFDMGLYGRSLLVEWSRGCYSRCSFCKNWRLFPVYRAKSPEWIIEELRYHNYTYSIDEFTVVDSILNGYPKQLYEVCSLIIKDNLKIRWSGQIAPRKDMDFEFFKHMRDAGCNKLQIGVESGSNKVLKKMRKAYTSEMTEATLRSAKRAGIETEIFVIVGFPGENDNEFKKTYNFIKRNQGYIDTIKSINTLHLIAGTEVYEKSSESFNMRPLSLDSGGWHYRWETNDGNNYKVRRERAQRLLDLAYRLGIRVMETNISEGKENLLEIIEDKRSLEDRLAALKVSIDGLQRLPQKIKIVKKKRTMFKWLILIQVSFYTLFYIIYFWIYMILRKKVLLGAK